MKAIVLSEKGEPVKHIEAEIFSKQIREDMSQKFFEAEKQIQPYAPFEMAGRQHSASGKVRHRRRKWRTSYGHGMARIPRKIFWRRGTQFYWVGAEISGTRGGRKVHAPKVEQFLSRRKINKKEAIKAFQSALAATGNENWIKKRYASLEKIKAPIIVEDKILKLKTKEFFNALKNILGENFQLALKEKKIRAGKGKRRNRRYKENAGLLVVIGKNEDLNVQGIEIMKTDELRMESLFPLGRLTIYTEQAVKELNELGKRATFRKSWENKELKEEKTEIKQTKDKKGNKEKEK